MIYITSHGCQFGVETENAHNGDWTEAAASNVKVALDAMGSDRVAAVHVNLIAVAEGSEDELSDDYNEACNEGCLVNEYPDFIVTMTAC
ncbi:MAG: hypothetical protein KDJ87_15095 [Rhizobiaceae bacterium]|nr:hypothetical protein [Rhizobiaceae bacterium]